MNGLRSSLKRLTGTLRLTRCFMTSTADYPGMERWKGRVAIVTGASAGMGYELTKKLAELGVVVVGCARNTKSVEVSVNCVRVCVMYGRAYVHMCMCMYCRHCLKS